MCSSDLFQVSSDGTFTKFKIVSASLTGEPIFTGRVDSVSDTNITFSTSIDEDNETVYPFFASGSFNKDVQVPRITSPTISSGSVPNTFSSSNIDYGGGFDSNLVGFTNAPDVVISPSEISTDILLRISLPPKEISILFDFMLTLFLS